MGCEHIIPLIRIVELYGPSIGVVLPKENASWKVFEEDKDSVAYRRHLLSSKTYEKREEYMAHLEGKSLDVIESGKLNFE